MNGPGGRGARLAIAIGLCAVGVAGCGADAAPGPAAPDTRPLLAEPRDDARAAATTAIAPTDGSAARAAPQAQAGAGASAPRAERRVVCGQGGPGLQAAIDAASPGDTIRVIGRCDEAAIVDKDVSIVRDADPDAPGESVGAADPDPVTTRESAGGTPPAPSAGHDRPVAGARAPARPL